MPSAAASTARGANTAAQIESSRQAFECFPSISFRVAISIIGTPSSFFSVSLSVSALPLNAEAQPEDSRSNRP